MERHLLFVAGLLLLWASSITIGCVGYVSDGEQGMVLKLFIGLTIVLCASVALGQDNRGGRRHNRGGDRASASRSARRVDPTTAAFLRRVDTNGNGMIDEDEVTGGAKAIVEGILTRLGIELKYPIPLSKIVSAGGDRRRGSRDDDGSRASSSEDKSSSDDSSAAPPKSGFAATKRAAVPGFGRPSERPSGSESKAAAPSKSAAAAASSSPSTPAKVRPTPRRDPLLPIPTLRRIRQNEWGQSPGDF